MGDMQGIGFGVENFMQEMHAQGAFEREKNLMIKQQKMNQANALNAYQNQVQGMRMAGLNPAGAMQHAPAVQSVSKGSADMAVTMPFNPQLDLVQAQAENINAQTAKLKEEERGVKQRNDITDTANDAAVQGYLNVWNKEQEDLEKALKNTTEGSEEYNKIQGRIKELEKMKGKITEPGYRGALGIADGSAASRKEVNERLGAITDYLKGGMDNSVLIKKLNNGSVDALAKMDKLNQQKLIEDINYVKQLINESRSKEDLNDTQITELNTKIEEIGDRVLRSRLSDENFIRMQIQDAKARLKANPNDVDAKKELELWKGGLDNLTDTEFRKLKYDVGSGVIKGAVSAGTLGTAGAFVNKILNGTDKSLPQGESYNWNDSGYGDGNVKRTSNWSPANPNGIGSKPDGVSQFDWNQMQNKANKNHYQ